MADPIHLRGGKHNSVAMIARFERRAQSQRTGHIALTVELSKFGVRDLDVVSIPD